MPKFAIFLMTLSLSMGAYAQETEGLNQCAVDLCGPASNKLTLSARGVFQEVVPLSVKAFLKSELSPSLDQSLNRSKAFRRRKCGPRRESAMTPLDFDSISINVPF